MKPAALKGVKHIIGEELRVECTLKPYEHYCPPDVPNDLSVRIYNLNPTRTYVVRIAEVTESVKLPNHPRRK